MVIVVCLVRVRSCNILFLPQAVPQSEIITASFGACVVEMLLQVLEGWQQLIHV